LGHAGAIVSKGRGSASSKIEALKKAGALIAETPEDIPLLVNHEISHKN
ncbi:MAG: succinate--CoA ligase subunit alpha, partial [Candidatus Wildermuthbacteria bacterium]|nr:succinate--CoA ligase subunit alpha [Candidatus Wildermuthbacteria bacterium]